MMSDPSAPLLVIDVPLPPRLSGLSPPPTPYALPVLCRPKRGLGGAYAAFMLLTAALGSLGLAAIVWSWASGGGSGITALVAVISGFTAFWCGAISLTLIGDVLRPGPALVIDERGFEDRRQRIRLSWDDVVAAEIRPRRIGPAHIALKTRDGILRRGAPFRMGAYRRRGDQIVAPLMFLTPPPYVSAYLMAALIKRAGGTVTYGPSYAHLA